MKFKLPSFTLTVRDLTSDEWARESDRSRDYYRVTIRSADGPELGMSVGSPVYGKWSETLAARSALSFASEPNCWDDPAECEWVRMYGEELTNEAIGHRVLGKEMRNDC